MSDQEVLNVKEAAQLLGTHAETVRRLARRGEIPCFKVGSDWRFSRDALRQWFDDESKRTGMGAPGVLIVDDDPTVVRTMSRIAESAGCAIRSAVNGREALEIVDQRTPDLIFLDLDMPEMNGADFLDRLRVRHQDVPVVIVTGHPNGQLMHRVAQHAPVMVVSKPAHADHITRTIRTVLGDRLPRQPREAVR